MATLPSKNAFNDLSGGYYSYWTDGTTEGRATVAVLLGSTDAQAAAASFSSLALGTPLSAANGGTGLTSISTLLNSNVTPATLGLVIGTNVQAHSANLDALAADPLTATTAASTYQPLDADLTAIAALSSADGNFIVGSATGWAAESGATARTSLGLGNVENTALSTWAGSTSITTLGTIATGVWNGTAIDSAYIDQSLSVATLTASTSVTVASDLTLASGSITSASGAISFSNENLSTTGRVGIGAAADANNELLVSGAGDADGAVLRVSDAGSIGLELSSASPTLLFYETDGSANQNIQMRLVSGVLNIGTQNDARNSFSSKTTFDQSGNWNFGSGSITTTGTLASGAGTFTGTTNDGSSLLRSIQSGTGRALEVNRSAATATRPVATFANTNAAGGTQSVVLIQQADVGEYALGINSDGSLTAFNFSVKSDGTLASGNATVTGTATVSSTLSVGTTSAYGPLHVRSTNVGGYAEGINLDVNDTTIGSGIGIDFNLSTSDLGAVPGARIRAARTASGAEGTIYLSVRDGVGGTLGDIVAVSKSGATVTGTVTVNGTSSTQFAVSGAQATLTSGTNNWKGFQYVRNTASGSYEIGTTSTNPIVFQTSNGSKATGIITDGQDVAFGILTDAINGNTTGYTLLVDGGVGVSVTGTLGVTGNVGIGTNTLVADSTYDDMVVEAGANAGISVIATNAAGDAGLMLGGPSNTTGAMFRYNQASTNAVLATRIAGHSLILRGDANVTNLTLSGASGSELATFAGKIAAAASTTARASLNIPSGTAPTSPTNGDIWSDGSDILVRLGGTTYTLTKA